MLNIQLGTLICNKSISLRVHKHHRIPGAVPIRRHPVVLLGHRVHLHEDAADGVVGACTEVLVALALEPVRSDVAVGSVQASPHLVLLPAEAEEAASGSGVACCQAVAAHPHSERQVIRSGDDRVPVLGYHPHAAQVVAQEVLHLAALQVDVAEVRHYSPRIEELGVSITYQRAYISGKPKAIIRTPHSRPRPVSVIDRLA